MAVMGSKLTTRHDAKAVSFAPATNTFYHGALGEDFDVEGRGASMYYPIARINRVALAERRYDEAIEFLDHENVRRWERSRAAGELLPGLETDTRQAAVDATSLANITRVELSTAIINEMYKDTYLHLGATFVPVPKLKYDYDVIDHMQVRGKAALVGKRMKAQSEAPSFTQTKFELDVYGKLQRMIDVPDEDEYTALLSPTKHMISDVTQVISQDINSLILEDGIQQFKPIRKGSWQSLASTGNQSSRNPLTDISNETQRITRNHGRANIIAMNQNTYAIFVSNTYVRGYEQMLTQRGPGEFTFSKLPGITFLLDVDIPDGVAAIYDKRALTVGDGPMVTEAFRNPQEGLSGHVIRKWIQPVVNTKLKSAFGTYMTNLAG